MIEANPRASRTVPFVAKVLGRLIAKIAARLMAGSKLSEFGLDLQPYDHIAVKEAVFPFARFPGVDTVLGPEMRSTGEVMGLDTNFALAFAKSQLGGGTVLPETGTAFISVRENDKQRAILPTQSLLDMSFKVIATRGTAAFLAENGLDVEPINKVLEGRPHIVDAMKDGDVQLVVNTTEGEQSLADSKSIRRTALVMKIPYYTTMAGAEAAIGCDPRSVRAGTGCQVVAGLCRYRQLGQTPNQRHLAIAYLREFVEHVEDVALSVGKRENEGKMEKVPMTADGYAALDAEVKKLKGPERQRIIKAIAEARAHGDLSENAEYHAAKEQQSHNEGRVMELEDVLNRADVIDVGALNGARVKFGATVDLVDEDTEAEVTYQIVGEYEANVEEGKISIASPIARALISKEVGDSVEVNTPGGGKSYEILDVKFV